MSASFCLYCISPDPWPQKQTARSTSEEKHEVFSVHLVHCLLAWKSPTLNAVFPRFDVFLSRIGSFTGMPSGVEDDAEDTAAEYGNREREGRGGRGG